MCGRLVYFVISCKLDIAYIVNFKDNVMYLQPPGKFKLTIWQSTQYTLDCARALPTGELGLPHHPQRPQAGPLPALLVLLRHRTLFHG